MSIQNSMLEVKARCMALGVGIQLERVNGGFLLFSLSSEGQLGYDLDQPWSAEDVIDSARNIRNFRRQVNLSAEQ